jgi:hypothetical protein
MKWLTALDLDRWADTIASRADLSEVISALVRASATDIQSFRFPTGDSAQIAGYDGRLTASGLPPYIPDGESVWEFGVTADYLAKANDNYEGRTGNPGAVPPKQTTFVFVTARSGTIPRRRWTSGRTSGEQEGTGKMCELSTLCGLRDRA